MKRRPSAWLKRTVAWGLAIAVLGAVFLSYRQPALMVDLANRFWSCF